MKNFSKLVSLTLFISIFLQTCSTIDVSITKNKEQIQKLKNIAILSFDFKGDKSIGKEFSNSLSILAIRTERIQIIERNEEDLQKIFGEFKLSRSGLIDEATAASAGKVLGVDGILIGYGETEEFQNKTIIKSFRLKLIHVQNGSLVLGIIKEPGIEWTWGLRLKYLLGLGLVWTKDDLFLESNSVGFLAEVTSRKIVEAIQSYDIK
ncbi:MAG: CsgG/HfaB family protein [Leptospiraceae bacterium]|nr:CsgG/HfaB family protein [Leptospiraceae bacterium]